MTSLPIDPLERIFEDINSNDSDNSLELFKENDVTLRTDLINKELVLANAIVVENKLISKVLPGFDLYGDFIHEFKRHKVSLDRKSRAEFVAVNTKNTLDRDLARVSDLKNLTDTRN